jgi:hypothetical protein
MPFFSSEIALISHKNLSAERDWEFPGGSVSGIEAISQQLVL